MIFSKYKEFCARNDFETGKTFENIGICSVINVIYNRYSLEYHILF